MLKGDQQPIPIVKLRLELLSPLFLIPLSIAIGANVISIVKLVAETLPASDGPPAAVGVAESALALLLALLRVCGDTRNVVRQQWLTSQNEASIERGLGRS